MAKAPAPERLQWDVLPVAGTRPAMKGGVPFVWVLPIFFVPCILVLITFRWWFLLAIPALWFIVGACYVQNANRPFEWMMWLMSGAFISDWHEWGGISRDPHGTPSDKDFHG
jgi:type IV secretory pathway VirB3-like protein